jgi:hypothetical protein
MSSGEMVHVWRMPSGAPTSVHVDDCKRPLGAVVTAIVSIWWGQTIVGGNVPFPQKLGEAIIFLIHVSVEFAWTLGEGASLTGLFSLLGAH